MDIRKAQQALTEAGQPAFRIRQVKEAVFAHGASSWDGVTTLPLALRASLAERVPFMSLQETARMTSAKGDTVKLALRTADGKAIETVLMRHDDGRRTACVSSQAGCPMACAFCATGKLGLLRNLTTEEITDQVLLLNGMLAPKGERVTNIVFMGMGEPMHNLDAVLPAIRALNDPEQFGIGARRISVSTCGIVPGIARLAKEQDQVNLAISLHAPTDDLRSRLMPVNAAYPLADLMDGVRRYAETTNRKVFFEYLLIDGVNDGDETAEDLADIMNHPLYHVNLIKYHSTGAFQASPREQRERFKAVLERRGVPVTHRISFGEDIMAACGQLAGKK